jgi:hypothetical protein
MSVGFIICTEEKMQRGIFCVVRYSSKEEMQRCKICKVRYWPKEEM